MATAERDLTAIKNPEQNQIQTCNKAIEQRFSARFAARLLRHLWHEVYLDSYPDDTVTIECETCNKIIASFQGKPGRKGKRKALQKLIQHPNPKLPERGQLWVDSLEAVAEMDLDQPYDECVCEDDPLQQQPIHDENLQIKNFLDVPE